MTAPLVLKPPRKTYQSISECLICNKPLGSDSRDSGYVFCHDCSKCTQCGERLSAAEQKNAYDRFLESLDFKEGETEDNVSKDNVERLHAQCLVLTKKPVTEVTQVELDFLNNLRLLINAPEPNLDVSIVTNENSAEIYSRQLIRTMTIDQMRVKLAMIEAVAASVRNAINLHANYKKEDDARFNKVRFTAPTVGKPKTPLSTENGTIEGSSTTPILPHKTTQTREEALVRFTQVWGIEDKVQAKTLFSNREKARKAFLDLKMDPKLALEKANEVMLRGNPSLLKKEGEIE